MTQTSLSEVRVRFAPSPTGFLHIGGVRTALFNWLYAKKHHGKFLLRIEDTDVERSEDRFVNDILSSLRWLGITWDEEIVFQKNRIAVYQEIAEDLIRKGLAYRCYSTEDEVEVMRRQATELQKKPMYDRTWRDSTQSPPVGRSFAIRAKLPLTGMVGFDDMIRGRVEFPNEDLDDFVIIRTNGVPTYNFAVVVDDLAMKITHVIRGDDHINNTPKQIHLYQALGATVPLFAHLPMILGQDKKKLSKRNGEVSANAYRREGYLPEAVLNFLVRLGWSHGDQEVFSAREMIEFFDFNHVQVSGAVFNTDKLLWLAGDHMRKAEPHRLSHIVQEDFAHFFPLAALARLKTRFAERLIALVQPKVKLIQELADQLVPLCTPGAVEVDPAPLKWNKDPALKTSLQAAIRHLANRLNDRIEGILKKDREGSDSAWGDFPSLSEAGVDTAEFEAILRQVSEEHGVKLGDLTQPIRLMVTGRMVSAGLFELSTILPWDVVRSRLEKAFTDSGAR